MATWTFAVSGGGVGSGAAPLLWELGAQTWTYVPTGGAVVAGAADIVVERVRARGQHWRDTWLDEATSLVRRTVRNWVHYRTPDDADWQETDPAVEDTNGVTPGHWALGTFEFLYKVERGPLQVYLGDPTDPESSAVLGVRRADRPEVGYLIKPLGLSNVPMEVDRATLTARWRDAKPGMDFEWTAGGSRVTKWITYRTLESGDQRFAYLLFPGCSARIADDGGIEVLDAQGAVGIKLPPPYGLDANDAMLRASYQVGAAVAWRGQTVPTFTLVREPTDLAAATLPVRYDPTATVSGTTNIEDALIYYSNGTYNYGSMQSFHVGNIGSTSPERRAVLRCATAAIPAGTITAVRYKPTRAGQPSCTQPGRLVFYRIADANVWTEGTANGATQAGSVCWQHRQNPTLWAGGSNGCGVSGTDFDADASPPGFDYPALTTGDWVLLTIDLRASWFSDWRDGVRVNNGLVVKNAVETVAGSWAALMSAEGIVPPTFEIDYTLGPAKGVLATDRRRRRT